MEFSNGELLQQNNILIANARLTLLSFKKRISDFDDENRRARKWLDEQMIWVNKYLNSERLNYRNDFI